MQFSPTCNDFEKKPKYDSEPARRVLQASVNFFCDIPPDKVVLNNPLCLNLPWFDDKYKSGFSILQIIFKIAEYFSFTHSKIAR